MDLREYYCTALPLFSRTEAPFISWSGYSVQQLMTQFIRGLFFPGACFPLATQAVCLFSETRLRILFCAVRTARCVCRIPHGPPSPTVWPHIFLSLQRSPAWPFRNIHPVTTSQMLSKYPSRPKLGS